MGKTIGRLLEGDNLELMRKHLAVESVDLVYLDPPFFSGNDYKLSSLAGASSGRHAFRDYWTWDESSESVLNEWLSGGDESCPFIEGMLRIIGRKPLFAYLLFLASRLSEIKRALKPSGSLYLHCDANAAAHVKLLLDAVFGSNNYLGTVVWCYGLGGSHRRWPHKHDDLHWYSRKPGNYYFEATREPARSARLKGRTKKSPDYWLIPSINNMAHERTGYPTQKPLELLERIVLSSCPTGGLVLDPFCGSGTTLLAAERNGRTWIGMDCNRDAIEIAGRRLAEYRGEHWNSSENDTTISELK